MNADVGKKTFLSFREFERSTEHIRTVSCAVDAAGRGGTLSVFEETVVICN